MRLGWGSPTGRTPLVAPAEWSTVRAATSWLLPRSAERLCDAVPQSVRLELSGEHRGASRAGDVEWPQQRAKPRTTAGSSQEASRIAPVVIAAKLIAREAPRPACNISGRHRGRAGPPPVRFGRMAEWLV